jgi:hypothetical protein
MKELLKNQLFIGGTILMLAATSALGADNMGNDQDANSTPGDLYRSSEFSVDVFGTAALGEYTIDNPSASRVKHNTRMGAGAGVNCFFTRYLGIGADAYSENTTGAFIDSSSANLILRLPLGQSGFAPYAFGGGGHQFDLARASFAQVGAGMEYRFTPNIGTFVDARWVVPDRTRNYGVGRLGLRLAF